VHSRVCLYDDAGNHVGNLSSFGADEGQITRAGEIGLTTDGRLLIADRYQGRIGVFGTDGRFHGDFGRGESGETPLALPMGIDIDDNGLVYAVSNMGASISIFRLPPAVDDAELVTIIDQLPPDGSIIQNGPVTLQAAVEAYLAEEKVTGIEFRVMEHGSAIPIAESSLLRPDESVDLGESRHRVTVRWTPDMELKENTLYFWHSRVHTADRIGEWSAEKTFSAGTRPDIYRLEQNVPNPFNPETRIAFSIGETGDVSLEVINILGQKVRILVAERMPAGEHEVVWDGRDDNGLRAASGLYFYRLSSGGFVQTRKMVLLK
jgi:hypothetical protein